jgi:Family of unknown function (DUF5931)/Histidine kinase
MSTSDALGRRDAVDPAGTARSGRRGATVDVRAALVPLWRGQVVFRVVALVYAVVNVVRDVGFYVRPALGVAVVVVMALWTLATSVAYLRGARRLAVVDLVVTVLATISTLAVDDPARIAAGGPVITTVWSAGAVLAVAIAYGIRPAVGAVAVSAAALWVTRRALDAARLSDIQLLLVAGVAVGFASVAMRRSAVRLQEAIATEAAAAERERLARDIHDGVLQVLALMRRRGPALGDPELVRAAAEQEVTLRRLITRGPVGLDNLQMPHLDGVGATAAILAALPGRGPRALRERRAGRCDRRRAGRGGGLPRQVRPRSPSWSTGGTDGGRPRGLRPGARRSGAGRVPASRARGPGRARHRRAGHHARARPRCSASWPRG